MQNDSVCANRARYIAWLRREFPDLYDRAVFPMFTEARNKGLAGFFDSLVGGFKTLASNVSKALPGLAQSYAQYDLQRRLIAANTQRAMSGQPPLQYDANGQLVIGGGIPYTAMDMQLAQSQLTPVPPDNRLLYVVGGFGLLIVLLLARR